MNTSTYSQRTKLECEVRLYLRKDEDKFVAMTSAVDIEAVCAELGPFRIAVRPSVGVGAGSR
jgi:hypothetical protein